MVGLTAQHFSPGTHSHPGILPEVAADSIAAAEEEQLVGPGVVVGSFAGKVEP